MVVKRQDEDVNYSGVLTLNTNRISFFLQSLMTVKAKTGFSYCQLVLELQGYMETVEGQSM